MASIWWNRATFIEVLVRCLIVKASSLGDIIHAFPTVSYLRHHYPHAHITWVVERPALPLVAAHPAVDSSIVIDTKLWRKKTFAPSTWRAIAAGRHDLRQHEYDLVLDLQGNIKSALIVSLTRSSNKVGFAKPYVAESPNTWAMHRHVLPPKDQNIRDDYLYLAHKAIDKPLCSSTCFPHTLLQVDPALKTANQALVEQHRHFSNKIAMFCAGSAWRNKQLTEASLAIFLRLCAERLHVRWLLTWGNQEERILTERLQASVPSVQCVPSMPLPQLQHLMSLTDLVVSMDSLPLHLAATAGIPTYSCFGPSNAAKYAPIGEQHVFYQGTCPYHQQFERRCPKLRTCATGSCMRDISPYVLYAHFATWWLQRS
jgi:heptosyltransferase-1